MNLPESKILGQTPISRFKGTLTMRVETFEILWRIEKPRNFPQIKRLNIITRVSFIAVKILCLNRCHFQKEHDVWMARHSHDSQRNIWFRVLSDRESLQNSSFVLYIFFLWPAILATSMLIFNSCTTMFSCFLYTKLCAAARLGY